METLKIYIRLLRPRQWVKNLFVLAAPFFGGHLFRHSSLGLGLASLAAFSLCASSNYILNDIADRENDAFHPKKKLRPIAAGKISVVRAAMISVVALLSSLALAYWINKEFLYFLVAYFVMQIVYSAYFKKVALVDIFFISFGFVIRVLSGGAAFGVKVSNWLFVTMFMVSLVLAAGKRLGEMRLLSGEAALHRKSLCDVSEPYLNDVLTITSAASLIAYAMYTIEQFQDLAYTVPIVTFGLLRYLRLAKNAKGDPTEALLEDRWLALTVVVWL
ncbi:MAG: decaprenyl-phosphate phosphoribosyltransferase, partial [Nitrospirae bacterium]|nr:decaprenyl-phosphate phosphoribosyltransferase [Nitrospirota bacterium]